MVCLSCIRHDILLDVLSLHFACGNVCGVQIRMPGSNRRGVVQHGYLEAAAELRA